jgi:hypothetical protein
MNNATTERINALVTGLQRKCGTYAAYVMGCRCDECRSASSRYQREAAKRKANGDFRGVVSADRARAHILALSAAGVGKVIVADEARVNRNIIHAIRVGRRTQIRANTEARILAVDAKTVVRGDRSLVDAGPTWKLLDELLERGYSRRQLATWLYKKPTAGLQLKREFVAYRTAVRVREMYDKVNAGLLRRDR